MNCRCGHTPEDHKSEKSTDDSTQNVHNYIKCKLCYCLGYTREENTEVYIIVALEGGIDWAAYYLKREEHPWRLDTHISTFIEHTASQGTKLSKNAAEKLFPEWKEKMPYRDF